MSATSSLESTAASAIELVQRPATSSASLTSPKVRAPSREASSTVCTVCTVCALDARDSATRARPR
jgi:hypothetical protein